MSARPLRVQPLREVAGESLSVMGEKGARTPPYASPWASLLRWAVEAKRRLDTMENGGMDEVATASAKLHAEEPR